MQNLEYYNTYSCNLISFDKLSINGIATLYNKSYYKPYTEKCLE